MQFVNMAIVRLKPSSCLLSVWNIRRGDFLDAAGIVADISSIATASGAREMKNYKIRALTSNDESILWTMLMYAAHESSVENVRENPALDRYVKDWGRSGDIGLVAIDKNGIERRALGSAWLRLFTSENRGFGYVDAGIPELAIAVLPEYRGRGIGANLLLQIIELAKESGAAISLSVRATNPVVNLYVRTGFIKSDGSEIMNRTGETSSFNMIYRYPKSNQYSGSRS